MSRGSSGRADDVCAIPVALPDRRCFCLAEGEARGVTVGNSPPRLGGVIVALGMGSSVVGGSGGTGGTELPTGEWLRWLTTVVTAASAGDSDGASTVTVRVIGAPTVAAALTLSVIISSNAWLAGSVPIVHFVP